MIGDFDWRLRLMYNIRTDITRLKSAQKILNEKPSAQNPQSRVLNEADRPWEEGNHDFERGFEHVQGWISPQREGGEHRSPYSLVELAGHKHSIRIIGRSRIKSAKSQHSIQKPNPKAKSPNKKREPSFTGSRSVISTNIFFATNFATKS